MITLASQSGAERYLIGRTIVRVETQRVQTNGSREALHINALHFADGSSIIFDTAEMETEYATIVLRFSPKESR